MMMGQPGGFGMVQQQPRVDPGLQQIHARITQLLQNPGLQQIHARITQLL